MPLLFWFFILATLYWRFDYIHPAWQLLRGRVVLPLAYVYDCAGFAGIAQLVEQRIRNAQVMGSSPFTGSRHFSPSYFAPLVRGFFYGSKDTLSCLPSSAIAILTKLVLYGVAPPRPSPYRTLHHP